MEVRKCPLCGSKLQTDAILVDGGIESCRHKHYREHHSYGGSTITINNEDFFLDESGYGNAEAREKIEEAVLKNMGLS